MKNRKVIIDGNEISISYNPKGSVYSAYYRTDETRRLDEMFYLDGNPLDEGSEHARRIMDNFRSSAGRAEMDQALAYFGGLAISIGNVVGVREDEIRKVAGQGTSCRVRGRDLDECIDGDPVFCRYYRTLSRKEKPLPGNKILGHTYLKRINLTNRTSILVPINIRDGYRLVGGVIGKEQ